MPSVVNQVERALLAIYRPGQKKHEAKIEDRHRYIFAGRSLEVYMEWCCRWAKWARDTLGMRRLVDADLMAQPWVQGLIDAGRSPWTVAAVISALRKLEIGIRARWGVSVTLLAPEHLARRCERDLKNRKRKGAYPAGELHLLRFYLSTHDDRMALDACAALGLRRREVAALQAGDVNLTATTFAVKQPDGTWVDRDLPPGYAGVVSVRKGKGGRPRQAPVPEWYHFMLADLVARAPSKHTRLWPVSARLFGYEVLAACRRAEIPSRGIHGLRHFWALQQYWHLRGLGRDDLDARQLVSWWLGHNRIQVTVNYIPRQPAPSSCVYGSYRE